MEIQVLAFWILFHSC